MRSAHRSSASQPGIVGGRDARYRFLVPPAPGVKPGPAATFSVIVAAYQVADVIGDALESIRRQTLPPHEVIVCDDGSSDNLEDALADYRDEIVFLSKENGGEASAKNAAAAAATGDFVAILDADDVYMPDRLAALSELAQMRPDLDILTSDGTLVAAGVPVRKVYNESWRFELADQRRAILQRNFIFGLAAVRRERLLEIGGFDEAILWTTDWDLWLRMILAGSAAGCVDAPLALYRLRPASLTAQRRSLLLGKLATLEKARSNAGLRENERPTLNAALASYRRQLELHDLRGAVAASEGGVRRQALSLVAARKLTARQRLEVAAMALAPRATGRVLRRRAAEAWVGASGIRVPRQVGDYAASD
jgi:glycosyltransferase involved in cell wall biosynthesis